MEGDKTLISRRSNIPVRNASLDRSKRQITNQRKKKREQSHDELNELKKKRVKFNIPDEEHNEHAKTPVQLDLPEKKVSGNDVNTLEAKQSPKQTKQERDANHFLATTTRTAYGNAEQVPERNKKNTRLLFAYSKLNFLQLKVFKKRKLINKRISISRSRNKTLQRSIYRCNRRHNIVPRKSKAKMDRVLTATSQQSLLLTKKKINKTTTKDLPKDEINNANDATTNDTRKQRTSITTSELLRLKNVIQEQENQILLLQKKLDNDIDEQINIELQAQESSGDDYVGHRNNFDNSDRRCYSLDPVSSYGYTSLISVNNGNTEETRLTEENEYLKTELQEVKDHVELLEFRILEFTEGVQKDPENVGSTCDQTTSTDEEITLEDVLHAPFLSLSTSLDSGVEFNFDSPPKISLSECKKSLDHLVKTTELTDSSSLASLKSLVDWVSGLPTRNGHPTSPMNMSNASQVAMETSKYNLETLNERPDHKDLSEELVDILSKLQDSLLDTSNSDLHLRDTIEKLREISASACRLQDQMVHLIKENKELRETVTTLGDSHETRTEASGTESELIHGKASSISSDLSDVESDCPTTLPMKSPIPEISTSFQESAVFETLSEMVNSATQTTEPFEVADEKMAGMCDCVKTDECSIDDQENTVEIQQVGKVNDLQKALARLSTIQTVVQAKDLRNLRLQDLQESDEYLVDGIEDEQVILSRIEYDTLMAAEQHLREKLEDLSSDRKRLASKCASLEEQLQEIKEMKYRSEETEVMRGAVRALEQRLESSEKYREQFFEEKCEYEEAENDARLMVQRLQSQLDAGQEMESLLSASLSQEQEFCRDLQRRLRDYQVLEKNTKAREAALLHERKYLKEKELCLLNAYGDLRVQHSLCLLGMILNEYWKNQIAEAHSNTGQIVPYSSSRNKSNSIIPSVIDNNTPVLSMMAIHEIILPAMHNLPETVPISILPNYISINGGALEITDINKRYSRRDLNFEERTVENRQLPIERQIIKTNLLNDMDMSATPEESPNKGIICQDSMKNSNLSDREEYYLQQIERLQHDKKSMRNDYELANAESLYQIMNLKSELQNIDEALQECQSEKCKLILKYQQSECALNDIDEKHNENYEHLKDEYSHFIENLRQEHDNISDQYEKRIHDLKNLCIAKEEQASELIKQQTRIHLEMAPYMENISCSESNSEESSKMSIRDAKNLPMLVRDLVKFTSSLRDKNYELREKESAYMETINEADKIMSTHVNAYTKHIEELETNLGRKNSSLMQLQELIKDMKEGIRGKCRCDGNGNVTELVDDLMNKYQIALRKNSWNIDEQDAKSYKMVESDNQLEKIDSDFWEKDQLLQKLMKLTSENNSIKSQLQEAHESARRGFESQQNENYLKGRVEELEMSECYLTEDRKATEMLMIQKEKKSREQILKLEEEICLMKSNIDNASSESAQAEMIESSLKAEIGNLKNCIQGLQSDLEETSDETVSIEAHHRSEVAKLRSQLNLVNGQLSELGALNGDIRDHLSEAEQTIKEVVLRLENKSKLHENDIVSFNLKLSQKDARLEELEAQIQQLSHSTAMSELDCLISLPISDLHAILCNIYEETQKCSDCRGSYANQLKMLIDSSSTFSDLINGRLSPSDSEFEDLCSKTSIVSSNKEDLDNDISNHSEESTTESLTNDNLVECNHKVQTLRPSAPPRPRRDAKRKKRVKKLPKQESSILQELQETAKQNEVFWEIPPESIAVLDDLRHKVSELEENVVLQEEDLRLADAEAAELHSRLMKEDENIQNKTREVKDLKCVLSSLREELLSTVQEYEKSRHDVEEKYKDQLEQLNKNQRYTSQELLLWTNKYKSKNALVAALLSIVRSYLRTDVSAVIKEIHRIEKDIINESTETKEDFTDYDLKYVSMSLNHLDEASCTPTDVCPKYLAKHDELPISHLPEALRLPLCNTTQTALLHCRNISASNTKEFTSRIPSPVKKQLSNTPNSHRKSRIPRLKTLPALYNRTASTKECIAKTNESSRSLLVQMRDKKPYGRYKEIEKRIKPLATVTPKIRSTVVTSPLASTKRDSASAQSLEVPPTVAKKVKRTMTGLSRTTVNQDRRKSSTELPQNTISAAQPTCGVPRPQNLRITRRVGLDGVVIAWAQMESGIAGFQVVVDGRVVQQVRSPKRTKALVTGLPFPDGFSIALVSVSTDGRCSIPALVTHKRSMAYKLPRASQGIAWGSNQKCIPACF